jgi:hypothetical protein
MGITHIVSHYADHVLIELLGYYLHKVNEEERDPELDYEYFYDHIYYLAVEMRNRKLKYIKLVVDNEKSKNKKKKPSRT